MTATPAPTMRTTYDNIPRKPYHRAYLVLSNDAKMTKFHRVRIELISYKVCLPANGGARHLGSDAARPEGP